MRINKNTILNYINNPQLFEDKEKEELEEYFKSDMEIRAKLLTRIDRLNYSLEQANKEIERLNNIIKEAKEYIESYMPNYDFDKTNLIKLLEILDKEDNV